MDEPGNALHGAASAGEVNQIKRLLLLPGTDVNARDDRGRTPLHLAADAEGHDDAVLQLLQAGADVDALDDEEASPLDNAASRGGAATAQLFLGHLRPPSVNRCWSAAGCAARRQHGEVFRILLDALQSRGELQDHLLDFCPNEARKAVWWVARRGNTRTASVLLDRCPAAVHLETDGSTMLIVAAMFSQTDMMSFLLDRGADPWREDSRHENAVTAAARAGPLAVINELWKRTEGAERLELWNARGREHPPLCKAAQEGRLEAVQLLLELGLDKDTSDAGGHTPLCLAAREGHKCSGVVKWLLGQGADWREAVLCAVQQGRFDIVLALLAGGADAVHLELDDKGTTMLHLAVKRKDAALVRLLLRRGADLLQRDSQSWTALHLAAWTGSVPVIEELWAHTEKSHGTRAGLLHLLARHSDEAALAPGRPGRLLQLWRGVGEKDPPLCVAAAEGHLKAVKRLVELVESGEDMDRAEIRGDLLDTRDQGGHSPLYLAVRGGQKCSAVMSWLVSEVADCWGPTRRAAREGHVEAFTTLINELDRRGALSQGAHSLVERGVVLAVAEGGDTAVATELLDRWPEVVRYELDEHGPAMLSVAARRGHAGLARTLLARGADVLHWNGSDSALHLAARGGHLEVINALWEHTGRSTADREKLQKLWAGLPVGEELFLPLGAAAEEGHTAAVALLLARGADPLQRDGVGYTALHWAARGGHVDVIDALVAHTEQSTASREELQALLAGRGEQEQDSPLCQAAGSMWGQGHPAALQRLVELGADLNVNAGDAGVESRTPLFWAAERGHTKVVRLLLELGASPRGPPRGPTPLHAAAEGEHLAVVRLLLPDPAQLGEDGRREQLALLQHVGEAGRTALHREVKQSPSSPELAELVELLITRELQLLEEHYDRAVRAGESAKWEGFTVYSRDWRDRTPLQCYGGRKEIGALLRHMEDERVMALGGTDVQGVCGMVREARAEVKEDEDPYYDNYDSSDCEEDDKEEYRGVREAMDQVRAEEAKDRASELDASLARLQRRQAPALHLDLVH